MASSKLVVSKMLLTRSILAHHQVRPTTTGVTVSNRLFSTNVVHPAKDEESNGATSSSFYDKLINKFSTTRRLSRFSKRIFEPIPSSFMVRPRCHETSKSLIYYINVPGMGVENVKISVENNTVLIIGEGNDSFEEIHKFRKYVCYIDLPDVDSPDKTYSTRGIKAEMEFNTGQVILTIPKLKPHEIAFDVKLKLIK